MSVVKWARSTVLFAVLSVLVIVAGTVVGANFMAVDAAPGAGSVTVSFNYNGASGGNSVPSATVASGASADAVLPFPTKSGAEFSGWFSIYSLINGQRITTIEGSDSGVLTAGFVPPELAQTLDITLPPPPLPSCANGGAVCGLGDIGPGGGLVFLISGGSTYELAPKAWSGSGTPDASATWCDGATTVAGTAGSEAEKVGRGATNTASMAASVACSSNAAAAARAYRGGGKSDWFMPSIDELNAMCNYSRNPSTPSAPSVACAGVQNAAFGSGDYGFASNEYWTSTSAYGWPYYLDFTSGGSRGAKSPNNSQRMRPVRVI